MADEQDSTLRASKDNLAGGLKGSRAELNAGSKHGSMRNLAVKSSGQQSQPSSNLDSAPNNAIVYENTYKLKPDKKFQSELVRRMVEETLATSLTKVKYDPTTTPELSKKIANEILSSINKMEFERYKFVVDVVIGEFKGQGIRVASRALWDTTTDAYASSSFRNASLFAVAVVFGCYFE